MLSEGKELGACALLPAQLCQLGPRLLGHRDELEVGVEQVSLDMAVMSSTAAERRSTESVATVRMDEWMSARHA